MGDWFREFATGMVSDLLRKLQALFFSSAVSGGSLLIKGSDDEFQGLAPVADKVVGVVDGAFAMVEASSGGTSPVQVSKVTLTTADLLALHITPIELIPAPGNGKVNVALHYNAYSKGAVGLDGGPAGDGLSFSYGDGSAASVVNLQDIVTGSFINWFTTATGSGLDQNGTTIASIANQLVRVRNMGDPFTDPGGADVELTIETLYRVIDTN